MNKELEINRTDHGYDVQIDVSKSLYNEAPSFLRFRDSPITGGYAVDLEGSEIVNALAAGKTQDELKGNLEKYLHRTFFQRHFDARTLLGILRKSKADADVVFLPSQAGVFPMQFYRFKLRGFNLDTIELNGTDLGTEQPRHEYDQDSLASVGYFLEHVSALPPWTEIEISYDNDATGDTLSLSEVTHGVCFHLRKSTESS